MRFFFPDVETMPVPVGHRFPAAKYQMLRALIEREAILAPEMLTASPAADRTDLLRAHSATLAPALASVSAKCAPNPPFAPVTSATRPSSVRFIRFSLFKWAMETQASAAF